MLLVRQLFGSSSNSWVRALIIFVLAWAVLVYVFVLKLTNSQSHGQNHQALAHAAGAGGGVGGDNEHNARRINQALQLLEHTERRNEELKLLIDELMRYVAATRCHIISPQVDPKPQPQPQPQPQPPLDSL